MKKFSQDWFSGNIPVWNNILDDFKLRGSLKFLEIGSFEGLSCSWLLDNILTTDDSQMYCIDTFEGSYEHKKGGTSEFDFTNVYSTFLNNIREYGKKVKHFKGTSFYWLQQPQIKENNYDFIYIDGCHESKEVLQDAMLSFELLKNDGIMIFDDYLWGDWVNSPTMTPKIAVDSFLASYAKYLRVIHNGYQIAIKKI